MWLKQDKLSIKMQNLSALDAQTILDQPKLLWSFRPRHCERYHRRLCFKVTREWCKVDWTFFDVTLGRCLIVALMIPHSLDLFLALSVMTEGRWQMAVSKKWKTQSKKKKRWLILYHYYYKVWLISIARGTLFVSIPAATEIVFPGITCDSGGRDSTWCIWNKCLSWK